MGNLLEKLDDLASYKTRKLINRLNDSKNLVDVLIQFERFIDSLDLYVYKHWFDGEVVDGPNISRYWISVILKYPYNKMPDPNGGLRLIKHGVKVYYKKTHEIMSVDIQTPDDYEPGTKKPKKNKKKIWLVEIIIPRKFIEELDDSDLELYADEIHVDDVSDAREDSIDSQSSLKSNTSNDLF